MIYLKGNNVMKAYFASPFFRPDQIEREERCKKKLRDLGIEVFSPKEACIVKPNEEKEKQLEVFNSNIENIFDSDFIFVVTDTKDIGTIFEAGVAYGANKTRTKQIKIVYYCETLPPGMPFNLMLARSGDVVITKFEDLDNLLDWLENGHEYEGVIQ